MQECVTCVRSCAQTYTQLMGQLPSARVNPSPPFCHCAVDFAGPFDCKCIRHHTYKYPKIYVAVFVCFVTYSVHLEVVSELTTDKFLEAVYRFVSLRG